ncbi:hypothetical protein J6590_100458 [Homalodisca vitripennis]|nr:hypothetical protein J6590_100458 [Homalodisca vitripennis]
MGSSSSSCWRYTTSCTNYVSTRNQLMLLQQHQLRHPLSHNRPQEQAQLLPVVLQLRQPLLQQTQLLQHTTQQECHVTVHSVQCA